MFLSYFISALLIFFPSHIGPLLLEVLMTSCSRSTPLSGSRNLLAKEIYKQHCKEMLSSISEQAMRISKVIPSPHSSNLLEKEELRQLWAHPYTMVQSNSGEHEVTERVLFSHPSPQLIKTHKTLRIRQQKKTSIQILDVY